MSTASEPGRSLETYRFESIVLDPPLTKADFRFVPPVGYRDYAAPTPPPPERARPVVVVAPRLPQISGKPGVWTGGGPPSLRVAPKVRFYKGTWVFDIEARGSKGLSWRQGSALARVDGEWRFATLVGKGPLRAIATFPKAAKSPPDALQVSIPVPGRLPTLTTFVFEWKP